VPQAIGNDPGANAMASEPQVLALIPARGGSKSIPMKNIAPLAGKPLIAHTIEVAQHCQLISRIVVSTDSERIRDIGLSLGAEAPFLRPAELAEDDTTGLPVFLHALEWLHEHEGYRPEIVVHMRPTTPLRRPERVDEAVETLINDPEADSVRAVSPPLQNPFKMWAIGEPYLEPLIDIGIPEPYNQPRQKLPTVYWQTGYIDIIRTATLTEKNSMTGDRILPYVMEDQFVVDIDQPFSLSVREMPSNRPLGSRKESSGPTARKQCAISLMWGTPARKTRSVPSRFAIRPPAIGRLPTHPSGLSCRSG